MLLWLLRSSARGTFVAATVALGDGLATNIARIVVVAVAVVIVTVAVALVVVAAAGVVVVIDIVAVAAAAPRATGTAAAAVVAHRCLCCRSILRLLLRVVSKNSFFVILRDGEVCIW